ncbi:hypothetical protein BH11BAC2_BH11BAC2_21070 [soil metagenome]
MKISKSALSLQWIAIFFMLMCTIETIGQVNLYRDTIIKAYRNGNPLKNPWTAGLNGPVPAEIDLNNDGIMDMIIFDVKSYRLTTWINNGSPGIPDYVYAPEYVKNFPANLEGWVKTFDYDGDGDMDLFSYNGGAIRYDRNDFNAGTGGLQFTLVKLQIQTDYGNSSANLYVSRVDAPALVDADGDGDMDIIAFSINGSWFEMNINFSMDSTGVPGNLLFYNVPGCWGYFAISNTANKAILPPVPFGCPYLPANPFRMLIEPANGSAAQVRDGGSMAVAFDMDGDGDVDLLGGDVLGHNLLYVENCGVYDSAFACSQDSLFPVYDTSAVMSKIAAPYYQDVDNDGIKDLMVGNFANSGEDLKCLYYYKNTGTNTNHHFVFQTRQFLVDNTIDVGTGAHPVFFDVDGDGINDLLIANDFYFKNDSTFSRVTYYRNTGTLTNPAYSFVSDDFASLSQSGLVSMALAFGDLDGDGDKDLIIGNDNGQLSFYRNIGGTPANFVLIQHNYQSIDVGNNSIPQIIDVDRDGKLDLLVGKRVGELSYYHNNGTVTAPIFVLSSSTFGNVNVRKASASAGFSSPILFDTPTGYELICGSESGYLYHYNTIDGNLNGTFTLADSMFQGISESVRAMPAMNDVDGDGQYDVIVGSLCGGVVLYTQNPLLSSVQYVVPTPYFVLYPNPAENYIALKLEQSVSNAIVDISDINGKSIYHRRLNALQIVIDISEFNSGIYLVTVDIDGKKFCRKLVKR